MRFAAAAGLVGALAAAGGIVLYVAVSGEGAGPKPLPGLAFQDAAGRTRTLADFRGKVVLLNVWATWCAPCREEMPALDRLQAKLGGPEFEVVALSVDQQGAAAVREFYDEVGVKVLELYVDPSGQAASRLATVGLPTTVMIDREGREIARRVGPAQWDAPSDVAQLRALIEAPKH